MNSSIRILGPFWRKWIISFALLSFVGLYSVGLLPHNHRAVLDKLNCPICHVVGGLAKLTAHSSPPGIQLVNHILPLLLVLPWVPAAVVRNDKFLFLKQSRAPPSAS
jgi:hypothetical protein